MTPSLCTSGCNSRGYDLSGLEYRYQCLCGNSKSVTLPAALPDSSCDASCTGDLTSRCGGASKLTIYQSSGTAPAPPTPVVVANVTTSNNKVYKYQACYTDRSTSDGRALVGQSKSDPANTIESCVSYCSASNYTYAGAE
ncbi:hypothetical protein CBS101457_000065 [Exobasidium rhododendri]|nr:hypothetical protein CBS101457_000065 [Exobasidium rhododendri]